MPQHLPRFHRMLEKVEDQRKLAKLLLETGEAAPPAAGATSGGDRRAMRGVPIVGRAGAGGAVHGTDPLFALLAKERQRGRGRRLW